MSEEIEFQYNTRWCGRRVDDRASAAALLQDIQNDNLELNEEIDPFGGDDENDESWAWVPGDASDIEDDFVIEANELDDSDEDEEMQVFKSQNTASNFYYGKDGTVWCKDEPSSNNRIRQHNVMNFRGGPKLQTSVPIEVFKKFFTENISYIIITETNRYARNDTQKWNEQHPSAKPRVWADLTSTELDAFIGLLLAIGVSHNNMQISSALWRSDALPIFRAAMPHKRFIALTRYIRFDDNRTREFRQQTDKQLLFGIYGTF